jgi:hemoglobin
VTQPENGPPPALDTPFDQMGGRAAVERLAARFYEVMERDEPALTAVHRQAEDGVGIHPEVKRRFALFLVGWLGGPQDYMAAHGHPRLRMRHARVTIGPELRDAWLRCMTRAMDDCGVGRTGTGQGEGARLRGFLDQRFAEVANFLAMDTGVGPG